MNLRQCSLSSKLGAIACFWDHPDKPASSLGPVARCTGRYEILHARLELHFAWVHIGLHGIAMLKHLLGSTGKSIMSCLWFGVVPCS